MHIVLFDGLCVFCSRTVRFLLRRDRRARLRFAPLQSDVARRLLDRCDLAEEAERTLVLVEEGRCYTRSTAALRILSLLGLPWALAASLLVVPRPLRDAVYDAFARRRYRWFGTLDSCFVPSPEERARCLDRDGAIDTGQRTSATGEEEGS